MTREPPSVAILAARIMRAYPSLSAYSAASLATELASIERAQRRHAERCCSGEDGGYVRRRSQFVFANGVSSEPHLIVEHDPDAEQRAGERIERRVERWQARLCDTMRGTTWHSTHVPPIELQDDPLGAVLLLHLPGEARAVGV